MPPPSAPEERSHVQAGTQAYQGSAPLPAETAAEDEDGSAGVADVLSDGLGSAGARLCSSGATLRGGGKAGAALYLGLVSSEKVEPGRADENVGSIHEEEDVDMRAALAFRAVVRAGLEAGYIGVGWNVCRGRRRSSCSRCRGTGCGAGKEHIVLPHAHVPQTWGSLVWSLLEGHRAMGRGGHRGRRPHKSPASIARSKKSNPNSESTPSPIERTEREPPVGRVEGRRDHA